MISAEDCEFIKKFEVANSEEKQAILTAEGHQVNSPAVALVVGHVQCSQKLFPMSLITYTLLNTFIFTCGK